MTLTNDLPHLLDQFAEADEAAARCIERREFRNNRYVAILERELRQTRELTRAWKGLALWSLFIAALLALALWSKW